MVYVNDLESMLLKVCDSFLVEVIGEEGGMDQGDSFRLQRPEAGRGRRCRHENGNAVRRVERHAPRNAGLLRSNPDRSHATTVITPGSSPASRVSVPVAESPLSVRHHLFYLRVA